MTKHAPQGGLADFIEANLEPILQEWEIFARSLMPLAELDAAALRDHAAEMLHALVINMREPQTERQRADKSKGLLPDDTSQLGGAARLHALARFHDQFTQDQLVAEFRAIRASVLRQWAASHPSGGAMVEEMTRFNEAIDATLTASIARYSAKLDEARTMILGVLAHDLRNPLDAVAIGLHYILRSEGTDADSTKAAARALRGVDRMNALIRDLLDFTLDRLGTGLPLTLERADIGLLCDRTAEEVETAHPGRRVTCKVAGDANSEFDSKRVSQMLVNLLTNALHHGAATGEVTVTVTGKPDEVVMAVHNDGPAIPQAVRKQLFIPLNRGALERAGASRSSGLGLGLYIALQIAKAHGGGIDVASTDADGTTFTVRLPRRPSA
jgi:signal transduction histidine kinase